MNDEPQTAARLKPLIFGGGRGAGFFCALHGWGRWNSTLWNRQWTTYDAPRNKYKPPFLIHQTTPRRNMLQMFGLSLLHIPSLETPIFWRGSVDEPTFLPWLALAFNEQLLFSPSTSLPTPSSSVTYSFFFSFNKSGNSSPSEGAFFDGPATSSTMGFLRMSGGEIGETTFCIYSLSCCAIVDVIFLDICRQRAGSNGNTGMNDRVEIDGGNWL